MCTLQPREISVYIGVVVAGSSFNNSASRATREEEGEARTRRTRKGDEESSGTSGESGLRVGNIRCLLRVRLGK